MFTLSPKVKMLLFIAVFAIILFFILHKPNNTSYNCEKGSCLQAGVGTKGEYGDETSCRSKCDTYMCTTDGYGCKLATGDDYPGPYVSNDACEAATACKKPMYSCGKPGEACVQDPNGKSDDPDKCQKDCRPDKYTCDKDGAGCTSVSATSPDYDTAEYENQQDCGTHCTWACTGGDDFGVKGECNFCNPGDSCDNPYQTKQSCDDSCDSQGCCFYRCDKEKGCVPAYAGGDPSTGGGAEYTTMDACISNCGGPGPGPGPGSCPSNTNCYLITPGNSDGQFIGYINAKAQYKPGQPQITSLGSVDSDVYNCLSNTGVDAAQLNWAYWDYTENNFYFEIYNTGGCPNEFGTENDTVVTLTAIQDTNKVSVNTMTTDHGGINYTLEVGTNLIISPDYQKFVDIVTGTEPYTLQSSLTPPSNRVSSLYGY